MTDSEAIAILESEDQPVGLMVEAGRVLAKRVKRLTDSQSELESHLAARYKWHRRDERCGKCQRLFLHAIPKESDQ